MLHLQSMKRTIIFKALFASVLLILMLAPLSASPVLFAQTTTAQTATPKGTCSDGIDNNGDGTIDWNGGTINGKPVPADPSCISPDSMEQSDTVDKGSLVPCTNNCDLNSAMQLINNLITFLIKVILFPVAIIMFMYAGYTYITSQGNPSKRADVKKMLKHLILGLLLILCAWLIVKTLLVMIGYTDNTFFFN